MSSLLKLECTRGQFHALHEDLDRVRSTSDSVRVDKAALAALLRDHGRVIGALRDAGIQTTEDEGEST